MTWDEAQREHFIRERTAAAFRDDPSPAANEAADDVAHFLSALTLAFLPLYPPRLARYEREAFEALGKAWRKLVRP